MSLSFSRIVLVASSTAEARSSAGQLGESLTREATAHGFDLRAEVSSVTDRSSFLARLDALAVHAAAGDRPILHVACPGDAADGLVFDDGTRLSWLDLTAALARLNAATAFDLVASFAAPYGPHLASDPMAGGAPALAIVAPLVPVDAAEVHAHLGMFHATLFRLNDPARSTDAVEPRVADGGRWFSRTADRWFEDLVVARIQAECDWGGMFKRAIELRLQVPLERRPGIVRMLRTLRAANRSRFGQVWFDAFFMVDRVPANRERFAGVAARVAGALEQLRRTGRYAL